MIRRIQPQRCCMRWLTSWARMSCGRLESREKRRRAGKARRLWCGGWGLWPQDGKRGAGARPLLFAARQRGKAGGLRQQTPASARRCRCARRSASPVPLPRQSARQGTRAQPPARLGAQRRAGGALRKPPPSMGGGAGRGSARAHHHTGARARRAPTTRPSAQPARGARLRAAHRRRRLRPCAA